MENLSAFSLSSDQWFYLFVLAIAILVICSLVTMLSVWLLSNRVKDINDKLSPNKKDEE